MQDDKEFEQRIVQNMLAATGIIEKTLLEVGNKFSVANIEGWQDYHLAHVSQKRVTEILQRIADMLED
jgi:hypothetical protein